jgi:hypothetical protein
MCGLLTKRLTSFVPAGRTGCAGIFSGREISGLWSLSLGTVSFFVSCFLDVLAADVFCDSC